MQDPEIQGILSDPIMRQVCNSPVVVTCIFINTSIITVFRLDLDLFL